MSLQILAERPIQLHYVQPNAEFLASLKANAALCEVKAIHGIYVDNAYHRLGYDGTLATVLTRRAIWDRLVAINNLLAPHYGLFIFDIFRTIDTQRFLYHKFKDDIRAKNPHLTEQQLLEVLSQYVSSPDQTDKNYVPAHNSGGAVDLAIYDRKSGECWDFGADFDETEVISHLAYFENDFDPTLGISQKRWIVARNNRRILFHLMTQQGFIGLPTEWWHFDLGDTLWAKHFKLTWSFSSLEQEAIRYLQSPHFAAA